MPGVDRNNPVRAESSDSRMSIMEFMRTFPDDASCLVWLWRERISEDGEHAECPKCERERRFHKLSQHPAWSCDTCGHHLHPTAGTIYHKSSTSLHLWFYAMYLMASTRCRVPAKHLERELGVTYKTAWRMANLIRNQLMTQDGDAPLSGDVEVDESAGGGKIRAGDTRRGRQHVVAKMSNRPTIFGAVERGGRVRGQVVRSRGTIDVEGALFEYVLPSSMIVTDEWGATPSASVATTSRIGASVMRTASTSAEMSTHRPSTVLRTRQNGHPGQLPLGCRAGGFRATSTSTRALHRRAQPQRIFSELLLRCAVGR